MLALYPVLLFYLSLAWIVLIGFQQGSTKSAVVAEGSPSTPLKSPLPEADGGGASNSDSNAGVRMLGGLLN